MSRLVRASMYLLVVTGLAIGSSALYVGSVKAAPHDGGCCDVEAGPGQPGGCPMGYYCEPSALAEETCTIDPKQEGFCKPIPY